ncbi:site-specific integrase [uncultured Ruminococcus sp.]|uniref:tyrosine-type recombinase/integrase n=1 Tax=uncultured Ruminococcus sp. TaxID=165186 RepID=UPI0025DA9B80|nr:site-specific integrase [uncultured Ruminococcus sp.]
MATITKRGDTFRIKVSLGYDTEHKQIVKSTTFKPPQGVTSKKAEKLAQQFAYDFENKCKDYTELNESMRFSELAGWYFENYAPIELKPSTAYTYNGQYKKHLKPVLGNMKLKDITTPKLTRIMKSYNLNPQTIKKLYVVLQSIFRRGVEQGFIRESPCHNVILPKKRDEKKKMSLDENEIKRLIELLAVKPWDEDFKRIVKVLLYTGMRSGECLGLMWEDIDFEEMTITINHNLTDIGGKHKLGSPKTESSRRVIGMSEVLASIFKEQKAYIDKLSLALGKKFKHPEMVFTSALGNYRDRCSVYHSLKRFTKGTEFEKLTLHKLRHCNATLLLNSGVDLKVVSEHLGHRDINITAAIYADVLKSTKSKVADLITLKLS